MDVSLQTTLRLHRMQFSKVTAIPMAPLALVASLFDELTSGGERQVRSLPSLATAATALWSGLWAEPCR